MRVFIGLNEVAGRNAGLRHGFEQLGHSVTFAELAPHWAGYDTGPKPVWVRVLTRLGELRRRSGPGSPLGWVLTGLDVATRSVGFLHVLATHELFIYSGGATLFRFWDYALIRFFGKKLICQFHGSDSRPPYLNGAYVARGDFSVEACIEATRKKSAMIRAIDRLATEVIDIVPTGYLHQRPCVSRLRVGLPCLPHESPDPGRQPASAGRRDIGVLHAPSSTAYKGTAQIRASIQRLVDRGHPIRYVEVTGKTNREVLEEIRRTDLVVSELYSDHPMSALVTEASWLGKPAITCGYAVRFWKTTLTEDEHPPGVYCEPEEFEQQLERLIGDASLRQELGHRMHEYVRRVHHPAVVARRYLDLARGDVPESWRFDPRLMRAVVGGFFMPREQAQGIVKAMVSAGGVASLRLSDKPELEEAVTEWAGIGRSCRDGAEGRPGLTMARC